MPDPTVGPRPEPPPYEPAPKQLDLEKIRYQTQVDQWKASLTPAAMSERLKQQYDTENKLFQHLHEQLRDAAKAAIARTIQVSELVQKAAGAIVTLYVGLLGLVFTASDDPLPLRAVFAAIMLGLAVALATAYSSYVATPEAQEVQPKSLPRANAYEQTNAFIRWARAPIEAKVGLARAATVALGVGVFLLPAAFVSIDRDVEARQPDEWPAIPTAVGEEGQDKLTALLFKARVEEVAATRAKQMSASGSEPIELGPAVLGAVQLGPIDLVDAAFGLLFIAGLVLVLVELARPRVDPAAA